jgi:hypothetical protein
MPQTCPSTPPLCLPSSGLLWIPPSFLCPHFLLLGISTVAVIASLYFYGLLVYGLSLSLGFNLLTGSDFYLLHVQRQPLT